MHLAEVKRLDEIIKKKEAQLKTVKEGNIQEENAKRKDWKTAMGQFTGNV